MTTGLTFILDHDHQVFVIIILQSSALSVFKCIDLLTFRPAICAVCGISSSLPAYVLMDMVDLQLNLQSQGLQAWRLSITGSLWLVDNGSHHPQRDCEEENWWGQTYLRYSCPVWQRSREGWTVDETSVCIFEKAQKDENDCPSKTTYSEFLMGCTHQWK